MSTPLVSVVVPVHNAGRFLARALASIRTQTFHDFEIVAVDDGSEDKGAEILSNLSTADRRIRVYRQKHAGLVAALNVGCSLARGTYIARMDADDVALPGRLAAQVARMQADPSLGIIGTAVLVVDEKGRGLYEMVYPVSDSDIRKSLRGDNPFAHPTIMMRRDLFEYTGGYRAAFVHAEDYDLWLRMAEHCRMANLCEVLLRYRLHTSQVSLSQVEQQIVSTVGAQVASRHRETGRSEPLRVGAAITLESMRGTAGHQEHIASRVLEAAAAKALYLALVGRPIDALHVLDWAERTGGAPLSRRARAKALLARATAHYVRGNRATALLGSARAGLLDPLYTMRMGRKGLTTAYAQSRGALAWRLRRRMRATRGIGNNSR